MQRALSLRDTSCKHPGCVNTHYLDAHHIKHWADGGETKLDNLVMLCRHHHQALHKGAFEISIVDDEVVFTSATGKHLHRSPHLPAASGFFHSNSIDEKTVVPLWQGEKMDYDMAVGGLL